MLEFAACESVQGHFEVTVDVIWMVLVLDEGSVGIHPVDPDVPELLGEQLQAVDETKAPPSVPVARAHIVTGDQERSSQLIEGELVVASVQKAICGEL